MAEQCCYYEALRKQRILDRAYEAKSRMLSAQEKVLILHEQQLLYYGMPKKINLLLFHSLLLVCILFVAL